MTSIWLRPEGRQEQQLQALIDRFAEENGTVAFAPHLTVCGVPGDLAVGIERDDTYRAAPDVDAEHDGCHGAPQLPTSTR